jgi:predicted transposase YbfD/YdcC
LPVEGNNDEEKQTNEIAMSVPLLDAISIHGKTITADALLTQHKFANYVVGRQADYQFTVKNNQPTLREDIAFFFENRQEPDFIEHTPPDHGRIETRKIWTTTVLNQYLKFPHVGQAFVIERESIEKKPANSPTKSYTESPVARLKRLMLRKYSRQTVSIGASKTVATM